VDPAALYRDHAPALMRYLIRLTGDQHLAEDGVHETFVRLVERPPQHEPSRAWLFTVATNVVREHGRMSKRRRNLLDRAPLDALHGDGARDPGELAESNDLRVRVGAALAALSPRDRTALLMREEGFTHEEIARVVDTTTKSVGTIIARALRKLARELPDAGRMR
jgi:RNA polymerase sigma factor (sigma-70 family)